MPDILTAPKGEPLGRLWQVIFVQHRVAWIAAVVFVAIWVVGSGILSTHARDDARAKARATLDRWTNTMLAGDVAEQAATYAPTVSPFFRLSSAPRSQIYADKVRLLRAYPRVSLYRLTNIAFESTEPDRVVVAFDKEWELSGRSSFSGKNHERLELLPDADRRWQITGEQEIQIYWVRRGGRP